MKFLLSVMLAAMTTSATALARPPNTPVDPTTSQWYQGLKNPQTGASCCDVADCRPTDFQRDPKNNTLWQAYISKAIYGADAPDAWVTIPADKILPQRDNPTGRVVICWYNNMIYCAVLPSLT